jgi:hypothetical protein
MGYATGVRWGHAGGHLRDPVCEAVERGYASRGMDPWWRAFGSREAARAHVGKLWHCTDIVDGLTRQMAVDVLGLDHDGEVMTYARLARLLVADLKR